MAGMKTWLLTAAKTLVKAVLFGPTNIFNSIWNFFQLRLNGVKHGPHIRIRGRIHIHGQFCRRGGIEIGDYFVCNSGTRYNPTSGTGETHITVGKNGKLLIGSHVGISNLNLTANNEVRIGDYTMIGSNCMITDTDFHSTDFAARKKEIDGWFSSSQSVKTDSSNRSDNMNRSDSQNQPDNCADRTPPQTTNNISSQLDSSVPITSSNPKGTTESPRNGDKHTEIGGSSAGCVTIDDRYDRYDRNIKTAPVIIGSDVFIGACVIILKGSKVGNRAVVGAGAVVRRSTVAVGSVMDSGRGETWIGNPARIVKRIRSTQHPMSSS